VLVGGVDLHVGRVVLLWRDGPQRHARLTFDGDADPRSAFVEEASRLAIRGGQARDALASISQVERPGGVLLVRGRAGRYVALAHTLQPPELIAPTVVVALEVDRELRLPILAADPGAAAQLTAGDRPRPRRRAAAVAGLRRGFGRRRVGAGARCASGAARESTSSSTTSSTHPPGPRCL
jgi:hypothetical protein